VTWTPLQLKPRTDDAGPKPDQLKWMKEHEAGNARLCGAVADQARSEGIVDPACRFAQEREMSAPARREAVLLQAGARFSIVLASAGVAGRRP
jgi:hypothetical protein